MLLINIALAVAAAVAEQDDDAADDNDYATDDESEFWNIASISPLGNGINPL